MTTQEYIPDVGDIIWLDFDPQAGHEQAGHRPALVLTPTIYNRQTGLLICCPLTTKVKGYPFEVNIAGTPKMLCFPIKLKALTGVFVTLNLKVKLTIIS
ncbi:type II toxin-antitoxin system PemK/MazF family toxin [Glaesserella parasuis]|nr:type II toxin-antitoxin system PemK/MazF family toxin [Glaesserella parasuis]MDP0065900.1 type II toxin-antitoxin system PemK/MazF family toxin [Glaesserella parasuis]